MKKTKKVVLKTLALLGIIDIKMRSYRVYSAVNHNETTPIDSRFVPIPTDENQTPIVSSSDATSIAPKTYLSTVKTITTNAQIGKKPATIQPLHLQPNMPNMPNIKIAKRGDILPIQPPLLDAQNENDKDEGAAEDTATTTASAKPKYSSSQFATPAVQPSPKYRPPYALTQPTQKLSKRDEEMLAEAHESAATGMYWNFINLKKAGCRFDSECVIIAAKKGHLDIVKLLYSLDVPINSTNTQGFRQTFMTACATENQVECFEWGHKVAKQELTPLLMMQAIRYDAIDILRYCFDHKCVRPSTQEMLETATMGNREDYKCLMYLYSQKFRYKTVDALAKHLDAKNVNVMCGKCATFFRDLFFTPDISFERQSNEDLFVKLESAKYKLDTMHFIVEHFVGVPQPDMIVSLI